MTPHLIHYSTNGVNEYANLAPALSPPTSLPKQWYILNSVNQPWIYVLNVIWLNVQWSPTENQNLQNEINLGMHSWTKVKFSRKRRNSRSWKYDGNWITVYPFNNASAASFPSTPRGSSSCGIGGTLLALLASTFDKRARFSLTTMTRPVLQVLTGPSSCCVLHLAWTSLSAY